MTDKSLSDCPNSTHQRWPANITNRTKHCTLVYCPQCKRCWPTATDTAATRTDSLDDETRRWAQPWKHA